MIEHHLREANHLYYTDIDTLFLDRPLPDAMIHSQLGGFKLKKVLKSAYFIAPKTYLTIDANNHTTTKMKGIKINGVPTEELLKFFQSKIHLHRKDD